MLVLILSTAAISSALQNGESVSLVGFGTFAVKARAARDGRNPQTGATIKIAAAKLPGFKAGKTPIDLIAPSRPGNSHHRPQVRKVIAYSL